MDGAEEFSSNPEGVQEERQISWEERVERISFQLQGAKEMGDLWKIAQSEAGEFMAERPGLAAESARYVRVMEVEKLISHLESDTLQGGVVLIAALDASAIEWLGEFIKSYSAPVWAELLQSQIERIRHIRKKAEELIQFRRGGWEQRAEEVLRRLEDIRKPLPPGTRRINTVVKGVHQEARTLVAYAMKTPFIYGELMRRFGTRFEAVGVHMTNHGI